MMILWLIGSVVDNVPPLRLLGKEHVTHLKNGRNNLSKIRQVMKEVHNISERKGVWQSSKNWNGATITYLWSSIWSELAQYLRTEGRSNSAKTLEKSRKGQICWRTCYNNMQKKKKCVANKVRISRTRIGN